MYSIRTCSYAYLCVYVCVSLCVHVYVICIVCVYVGTYPGFQRGYINQNTSRGGGGGGGLGNTETSMYNKMENNSEALCCWQNTQAVWLSDREPECYKCNSEKLSCS